MDQTSEKASAGVEIGIMHDDCCLMTEQNIASNVPAKGHSSQAKNIANEDGLFFQICFLAKSKFAECENPEVFKEADYLSGKAEICLLKKYCTKTSVFGKAEPSQRMKDYYNVTMAMLDEEEKSSAPDQEKVALAAYNLALIATNAAHDRKEKSQADFSIRNPDVEKAAKCISDNLRHARKFNIPEIVKTVVKQLLVLDNIPFAIFVIFAVLAVIGFFQQPHAVTPNTENIFQQAGNFFKYDVFHKSMPVEEPSFLYKVRHIFATAAIICGISGLFYKYIDKKKRDKNKKQNSNSTKKASVDTCEFQCLKELFAASVDLLREE